MNDEQLRKKLINLDKLKEDGLIKNWEKYKNKKKKPKKREKKSFSEREIND